VDARARRTHDASRRSEALTWLSAQEEEGRRRHEHSSPDEVRRTHLNAHTRSCLEAPAEASSGVDDGCQLPADHQLQRWYAETRIGEAASEVAPAEGRFLRAADGSAEQGHTSEGSGRSYERHVAECSLDATALAAALGGEVVDGDGAGAAHGQKPVQLEPPVEVHALRSVWEQRSRGEPEPLAFERPLI